MKALLTCVLSLVCLTASAAVTLTDGPFVAYRSGSPLVGTYATYADCRTAVDAAARKYPTKISGILTFACRQNVVAKYSADPVAGSASLSWTPPTQNTDGSTLTNLAGYRIVYGASATALTQTIQVANPVLTGYVVDGLTPGTYYFAVKAYTATAESGLSNIASKVIP